MIHLQHLSLGLGDGLCAQQMEALKYYKDHKFKQSWA
jgi:hypothetical protein